MSDRRLVLITGAGRSGTSTMAGTLHHLGLYVPGPYLGANASNPKGFYESRWSRDFHKRITQPLDIHDVDSRPSAFEQAQSGITPELRAELVDFLRGHAASNDQVVIKDPRSVWAQKLWKEAAGEADLQIRYVSMLRHPADVVGSRTTYYARKEDVTEERRYAIFNLARYINSSLISERETRGERRAFVRYGDLLTDWRTVVTRLGDELDLTFPQPFHPGERHPVDDFIDPGLNRHHNGWTGLDIPDTMVALADGIWAQLVALHDARGEDAAASAALDELSEQYSDLFFVSDALSHDATQEAVTRAREAATRKARAQLKSRSATPRRSPAGRTIDDASGRELLRAAGQRLRDRVRRR